MPSASIKLGRAGLTQLGARKAWLETRDAGYSPEPCYIVSSRNKGEDPSTAGFEMVRRKSDRYNPFGFVRLEVNIPSMLIADCLLKNASLSDPAFAAQELASSRLKAISTTWSIPADSKPVAGPANDSKPAPDPASLASDRQNSLIANIANSIGYRLAASIPATPVPAADSLAYAKANTAVAAPPVPAAEPPATPTVKPPLVLSKPFDLALIPETPSFMTWQGTITSGKDHHETIQATARMLGKELIEGRDYCWIEVEVSSSMAQQQEYWEAARVLIDAAAYADTNSFVIKQGFIAYGNKLSVFQIPGDSNLNALLDGRLQLNPKPNFDRIGSVDVLSMLFAADLKPLTNIGLLRAEIGGMLSGKSRNETKEILTLKTGEQLICQRFESPWKIPGLDYSFLRNSQIPFGFVDVRLDVNFGGTRVAIELSHGLRKGPLPADFSNSAFGTPGQLNELLKNNLLKLQIVPNHRVWTWNDAGHTYKAWAEFGGIIDVDTVSYVLLRDQADQEIRVPTSRLVEADLQFIKAGRIWAHFTKNPRRVLVAENVTTNTLEFEIPGTPSTFVSHVGELEHLHAIDQQWLRKLRAAKKVKNEQPVIPRCFRSRGRSFFVSSKPSIKRLTPHDHALYAPM